MTLPSPFPKKVFTANPVNLRDISFSIAVEVACGNSVRVCRTGGVRHRRGLESAISKPQIHKDGAIEVSNVAARDVQYPVSVHVDERCEPRTVAHC